MSAVAVEFGVLGPVEAWVAGRPVELGHARQRWVLGVLLIGANQWLSVDQLLDHAWGDRVPLGGRDSLYGYVSRLRRALRATGEADIVRRSGGYELVVDQDSVDVHRFRRLVAEARAASSNSDDDRAAALLGEALGLWRGEPCAGLDTPWVDTVRAELDRQRWAAELDHTDLRLRTGRYAEALADLTGRVAAHPLDERLAGQFMLALYRSGRQADALDHYQRLRTRLADELGTDPAPELRRLHQRILTADPALTTPEVGTDRPSVVPRQLPSAPGLFTGRLAELAELDRTLTGTAPGDRAPAAGAAVMISAIGGAGGIGKTWLALAWAHRNLHRFPDGQLFVDLHGFSPTGQPTDPADALRHFLTALGTAPDRLPSDLEALAALYRSLIADKHMLVVLDNAATADQVTPLLPGSPTCTVLVTGRTTLPSLIDRHGARHLSLDVLSRDEARALLTARLGEQRIDAEPDATDELIALCARHSLALAITARHAATRPRVPLAEFTAELRDLGLEMLDHDTDPTASLPTVLSWSLRHLTDEQQRVFALLGIAPGPHISLTAAASLTTSSLAQTKRVLRGLEDASLLDQNTRDRYSMHDLVRAYAAATARRHVPHGDRETALARVLDYYTRAAYTAERLLEPHRPPLQLGPPMPGVHLPQLPDDSAALAWFDHEFPNLLAAQHAAAAHDRHSTVWHLARMLSAYLHRRGYRDDLLAIWRTALNAAGNLPDAAGRIHIHRNLGHAHAQLGQHEEAVQHLEHALAMAQCHDLIADQAHTHRMLALAWEKRQDDRRALYHALQALALFRTLDQPTWEAEALNQAGFHTARLGDYGAARTQCEAAFALCRRHDDPEGAASALDSLGYINHHTGRHTEAIDSYTRALALHRGLNNTVASADTLDALGRAFTAVGSHEQARASWHEALELYRAAGLHDDADQVESRLHTRAAVGTGPQFAGASHDDEPAARDGLPGGSAL